MPWIVSISLLVDWILGDPRNFPHPVRAIGKLARFLEERIRSNVRSEIFSGILTSIAVYTISFFLPYFLIRSAEALHWIAGTILSVFIIYTTIALRDLLDHTEEVYKALLKQDLVKARERVSRIVARDTEDLEEPEIIRACIESTAESLVDGVTSPLFFAVFGGAPWAMFYRSINTLDSLFGYKNDKYRDFGWFPARVDDIANYIPARITSHLIVVSSFLLGQDAKTAFKILYRDGRKHPSPNSGLAEATVAGALKIQLGGTNYYHGIKNVKPILGDVKEELKINHIVDANRLIVLSSLLTMLTYFAIYYFLNLLSDPI
ncbi:cobalamin biosynthesis protein [Leptospira tipperaryensis]|uniref:Cobalamin biosynthesis protein CobD n=1 Tax=Leptospira tipperaryensis TaxID=2564040 RepID=A0A1D7V401_9LEPT|nr:adenosylcobinamide-phosphate synthase CbiB [Leptospira tipperaryensis]AOP36541.1 cobalamin biosynthesis protein [Leptospira tipperaryensis]